MNIKLLIWMHSASYELLQLQNKCKNPSKFPRTLFIGRLKRQFLMYTGSLWSYSRKSKQRFQLLRCPFSCCLLLLNYDLQFGESNSRCAFLEHLFFALTAENLCDTSSVQFCVTDSLIILGFANFTPQNWQTHLRKCQVCQQLLGTMGCCLIY